MKQKLSMLVDFLRYYFRAQSSLYIHSPLVFDFYNKVLLPAKNRIPHDKSRLNYPDLDRTIEVPELGAKSSQFKSSQRKLRSIVEVTGMRARYGRILHHIVQLYQPKQLLELGTGSGISSSYLMLNHADGHLITVDGNSELIKAAEQFHQNLGLQSIQYIPETFGSFFESSDFLSLDKLDLVFIDGNHQYEATLEYTKKLLPKLTKDAILIYDDIYWSDGMKRAWKEICSMSEIKISIDLFQLGICFINPGIKEKQHFALRY